MVDMTEPDLSQLMSPLRLEFLRRRALTEYLCCDDEFIWEEIRREEEEAKKPKAEVVELNANELASRFKPFLIGTFQNNWGYTQEQLDIAESNLKPEIISPSNINWDQRKSDTDTTKSGQYTLNPETQNINFGKAKVVIPDLNTFDQFDGKPLFRLGQYLVATYGTKYYLPGIEYWRWISKNPDKAPKQLNDEKNYFFFGSILRHRSGRWAVPFSRWHGSSFGCGADGLSGGSWGFDSWVVLLER